MHKRRGRVRNATNPRSGWGILLALSPHLHLRRPLTFVKSIMTVLNGNGDDPVARIWETVAELSDQLSRHRSFAAGLQAQIGVLKVLDLGERHRICADVAES
jgi:hypothetical protein